MAKNLRHIADIFSLLYLHKIPTSRRFSSAGGGDFVDNFSLSKPFFCVILSPKSSSDSERTEEWRIIPNIMVYVWMFMLMMQKRDALMWRCRLLCRGSGRTLFVYFNMSEEYMKSKKGNFWLLCVEVTFFQRFISDIFSCSQNTQTGQWHPEYL